MADKLSTEKRHDFTRNHDLSAPVKTDSSFCTLGWDNAHYPAEKGERADMGVAYFRTGSVRYLCHRFRTEAAHASENPGFDFTQAQLTGNCPYPRSFMGGIRSD